MLSSEDKAAVNILVVDDEPAYHALVRAILANNDFQINCVPDGEGAVEAVLKDRFDVIYMDIEMPGLNGYQVTAKIRQLDGPVVQCPIVAFTSLCPPDGVAHFQKAGMNDYLAKPFTVAELSASISKWTGRNADVSDQTNPVRRLAALIGEAEAAGMMERFHQRLEEAVKSLDSGEDIAVLGHRIGGLAGMMGFAVLSNAWLALQDGDQRSLPVARRLSVEALECYKRTL